MGRRATLEQIITPQTRKRGKQRAIVGQCCSESGFLLRLNHGFNRYNGLQDIDKLLDVIHLSFQVSGLLGVSLYIHCKLNKHVKKYQGVVVGGGGSDVISWAPLMIGVTGVASVAVGLVGLRKRFKVTLSVVSMEHIQVVKRIAFRLLLRLLVLVTLGYQMCNSRDLQRMSWKLLFFLDHFTLLQCKSATSLILPKHKTHDGRGLSRIHYVQSLLCGYELLLYRESLVWHNSQIK